MQATLHWSTRKFHHANKSSTQESLGTYFRSWGIYTPGDVAGVIGGKNGEGKATEFFVVRTRIPNGILRSDQVRVLAWLAENDGRGVAVLRGLTTPDSYR